MSDEEKNIEETEVVEETTVTTNGKKKREKKPKSKARVIIEWILTGIFAAFFIFAAIGQVNAMINKNKNFGENLPYGYGSFVVQTNSMEPTYKVKTAVITHKISGKAILEKFTQPNVGVLTSTEGNIKIYTALWTNDDLESKEHGYVDLTFMDRYTAYFKPYNAKYVQQTNATGVPMTHRIREIHVDESLAEGQGKYMFITAGINTGGNLSLEGQYQAINENYILGVVILNSAFLGGFFGFLSSPWGLLIFLLIPALYLVITSVLDIFKAMKDDDEEPVAEGATGEGNVTETKKGVDSLDSLSKEDKERLKREMLDEIMNKKGKK